jgi:O-antigen ligase
MNFITLGLLMKIALQPEMLSLQAFVSHDRGLPVTSVFLLSLPCIYFFNLYVTTQKTAFLIKFLFLLVFILIANHRTVWVTITFSLLINLFMLRKNVHFKIGKILQSLIFILLFSSYILALTISYSPSVEEKINTNITNILNPKQDETASWRILQMQSYLPIVENNFMVGMRWEGFELPIQFYHPEAGIAYFEDGTGHHFHSFYLDILFYFGFIGLVIFLFVMTLPAFSIIKDQLTLNSMQLSFFIFSLSGLVYGISYNIPLSYWLIFGATLAHLKAAYHSNKSSSAPPANINSF